MVARVDYDQIAPSYDARYVHGMYDDMRLAMRAFIAAEKPESVLEVGCGTGYWLEVICDLAPSVYGLDFSFELLNRARGRCNDSRLVRATADVLPSRLPPAIEFAPTATESA